MDESNDMHNAVKNNARQTVIDNNNNNSSDNNATNNNDGHNDEEVMKHQHIINHISLQPTILIVDAAKGGISPIRTGSRSSSNSRSSPTNSVEDGLTKPLFLAVIALVFGSSVQFGFQLACINSPRHLIEKFIEETSFAEDRERFEEMRAWIWSSIVAAFPLGAIFGCLIAATLSDTYGRKTTIFFNNIPATIAGVLMTFAYPFKIWYLLLIGRLVIGVSAGISSGVLSTFLTELAPVRLRGTLGGSNQLLITAAMLFSNILSFSALFGTETRWPYIFVFTFFPIIAQLILLRYCPESPRYTLIFGKNELQSEKDLRMLRGRSDVRAEIEAIQKEAREKEKEPKITFATLFTRELRWSTLIAIFLMFMQQMSGINAAMYYSNDIFKSTGLIGDQIILATCAIMLTNVLMTLASEWLVDHPLFGRRFLLLTGMLGMFLMSIGIVASLILISMKDHINEGRILAIVFMVMYVFAFAIGPGPIPWFYVGELFPSYSRASGTSIACAVNLMTNFWVGLLFPPIREHLTHYTFLIFTVALFFGTIITMFFIPETKGKTIEEIQQHLKKKRPSCI